jgi:hypothetical protein
MRRWRIASSSGSFDCAAKGWQFSFVSAALLWVNKKIGCDRRFVITLLTMFALERYRAVAC